MNRHSYIAALLCAGVLSACSKDPVRDISGPPPAASRIRFFNFGVNAPGVNFYANETKMTAITNSTPGVESTTGVAYGGVGAGGAYEAIAPGSYTMTGKIAAATDKDLAISPLTTTIEDGKYYSYYMSGIYNTTTKTVESFVVEDPVVAPTDFTIATVRFVHAISNANPMTLYAKNTVTPFAESAIGAELTYKGAGAFTAVPAGVYDLSTRYTGSATNVITRPGVSFVGGRVYTITARGDITVAPSTACGATNKTCLDNTANR
jgi:Domain of unknown function (DUF4397)